MSIKVSLSKALELFLPYSCLICRRRLKGRNICAACFAPTSQTTAAIRCYKCFSPAIELGPGATCSVCQLIPLPLYRLRYLWEYESEAREIINVMKYRPSPTLCKLAGTFLADAVQDLFGDFGWDLIVPVPSSKNSLAERGFNQCHFLAKEVRKSCGPKIIVSLDALRHVANGRPQASLSNTKRLVNVKNAFRGNPNAVQNKRILLIDDVLTTGATSLSCTKELLRAGASAVDLLCLARTSTWQSMRQEVYTGVQPLKALRLVQSVGWSGQTKPG